MKINNVQQLDWMKVPIDTKVQVRDLESDDWNTLYFICYVPNRNCSFLCFTDMDTQLKAKGTYAWRYCRLHPDTDANKKWVK